MSADDLSKAAYEMEKIGRSGNLEGANEAYERLENEFNRLAFYARKIDPFD